MTLQVFCLGEREYPYFHRNLIALKTLGDLIKKERIKAIFLPNNYPYSLIKDYCFHKPGGRIQTLDYPAKDFDELVDRTIQLFNTEDLNPIAEVIPASQLCEIVKRYQELGIKSTTQIF
jgi:hypothetical protein